MVKCANNKCDKEVVSIKGKRARKTCSNSCRQLFLKQRVAESKLSRVVMLNNEQWDKFVKTCEIKDLALLKNVSNITSVSISDKIGNITIFKKFDESSADTLKIDEIGQSKELTPLATKTDKIENLPPVKMDGENSIDFAARKNEWKSKNG